MLVRIGRIGIRLPFLVDRDNAGRNPILADEKAAIGREVAPKGPTIEIPLEREGDRVIGLPLPSEGGNRDLGEKGIQLIFRNERLSVDQQEEAWRRLGRKGLVGL